MRQRLVILLVSFLVVACSAPKHRYRIAVSQCSEDIWRDKLNRELKTGEYLNDSVQLLFASANDDDRLQIAQIKDFIKQGVDLLIVAPNQLKTISPAIDEAVAKGIPVIFFDRKSNTNRYTAFIGCDNYLIGRTMGQFIAGKLDGRGTVVEIRGLAQSSPAIERHHGFVQALRGWPHVRLAASEAANWKEEGGYAAMMKILQHHRDIQYVFAHNDRMALGARRAVRQVLPPEQARRVKYVGVDALPMADGGLQLVSRGVLEASYLYPTQGDEVLALAMRVLKRHPFRRDNYLRSTIITQENAEQMLMQANDMERQNEYLDTLHRRVDAYLAQYNLQKLLLWTLIGFLLLLIVASALVFRQYQLKTRLNEELQRRNDELNRLTTEINALTRSQTAFFTNISHELRTPLTLILDPLNQLLKSQQIPDGQRSLLNIVQNSAHTLKELVDMLLDFRKVEVGKMDVRLQKIDLSEVMQQWIGNFSPAAETRHIALSLDMEAMRDPHVIIDVGKLHRMLDNLLSNALKHTQPGGHVAVCVEDCGAQRYAIRVSDTGSGIAPELLPHVFERFVQSRDSRGGTGIGLALVDAFARLLGGNVDVQSEVGRGSTFTLFLPREVTGAHVVYVEDGAQEEPFAERSFPIHSETMLTERSENLDADRPCVLLVDDHLELLRYEQQLLAQYYRVLTATNGQEALQTAVQEVPDLIVSDVMMPVMDGLELCRSIKRDTVTCHIPVILLTAKHLDEQRIEGYEQGADSYITKPFNHDLLLARVRNLLNERRQLQSIYGERAATGHEQKPEAVAGSRQLPQISPRDKAFLEKVQNLLHTQMGNSQFNVETLSTDLGLSRVQLYRKIKALTGMSPVELLRKIRLQAARQLLETSDMNISEVAYTVGFSSPSYFTKCFREAFGMTPGDIANGSKNM